MWLAPILALTTAQTAFFADPIPVEMPRADAYLVTERGTRRLEDRYETADLWFSQTVLGQWLDADGRGFTLARIDYETPAFETGSTRTRVEWLDTRTRLDRRDEKKLWAAIDRLSPVDPALEGERPRQISRGCKDVRYWQGTNHTAIVCAFLPEHSESWYFASWELVETDAFEEAIKDFEERFLDKKLWLELKPLKDADKKSEKQPRRRIRKPKNTLAREREALRSDAHHSIEYYDAWRWSDDENYTVLDALGSNRSFVNSLTNELARMRPRYEAVVPPMTNFSNILCVARIFANRDDYLDAVGDDMAWTAAYWYPGRREIVAYLPQDGGARLLKTFRHEAFHQYLSYATCMITVSPWLNEGYAEYFEQDPDEPFDTTGLAEAASSVPALLAMDYEKFYAGTDAERAYKYRLALAIVRFIELGAPKVRFRPFENLKKDYFDALFESRNMSMATSAAFRNADNLELFVSEFKRYYLADGN